MEAVKSNSSIFIKKVTYHQMAKGLFGDRLAG
jgi:hypothetical protein